MESDTVGSGPFLLTSVGPVRDDEESNEGPLHDLGGYGMIEVHPKERLAPVPDWLYPYSLTVRTVQHTEWEVHQRLPTAFEPNNTEIGQTKRGVISGSYGCF